MEWFWFWLQVLPVVLGNSTDSKFVDSVVSEKPAVMSVNVVPIEGIDQVQAKEIGDQADCPLANDEEPLTAESIRRQRIERCLAIYFTKPIDANRLRPWSLMHGLIGYGLDAEIYFDGQPINAVSYLCSNGSGDKLRLLELVNQKQFRTRQGPGVQGHPGQLLAILAQAGASIDQPILVDGKPFKIRDLVAYEQKQCRTRTELTFMLIAFSNYLDPKTSWQSQSGEKWNMAKLLREELNQPIHSGACGGTHRLMGLSYAVRQMERHGYPLAGEWLQAARVLEIHQQHVWKYQNSDGGFSTEFFQGPGNDRDWSMQLYATGHILEWLVYTLNDEQLDDPRLIAAVDHLLRLMLDAPNHELDVGPRGHALHALRLYEQRVYGENSDCRQLIAAGQPYEPAISAQPLKHLKLKVKIEGGEAQPATTVAEKPSAVDKSSSKSNSNRTAAPRGFRRR